MKESLSYTGHNSEAEKYVLVSSLLFLLSNHRTPTDKLKSTGDTVGGGWVTHVALHLGCTDIPGVLCFGIQTSTSPCPLISCYSPLDSSNASFLPQPDTGFSTPIYLLQDHPRSYPLLISYPARTGGIVCCRYSMLGVLRLNPARSKEGMMQNEEPNSCNGDCEREEQSHRDRIGKLGSFQVPDRLILIFPLSPSTNWLVKLQSIPNRPPLLANNAIQLFTLRPAIGDAASFPKPSHLLVR
jgi:hypothetical protein